LLQHFVQRRFQALAEREAQLQKAREEQKQFGAWLVEAHQQQAAETARLQALAATLAAQEEQMRVLVLQVGGVWPAFLAVSTAGQYVPRTGLWGGYALHAGPGDPASDMHMLYWCDTMV
jgi:hypothetical protein